MTETPPGSFPPPRNHPRSAEAVADPPSDSDEITPAPPSSDPPVRVPDPAEQFRLAAMLFVATTLSVFYAGAFWATGKPSPDEIGQLLPYMLQGWVFAVPLLSILVCHEMGHYIAARIHRVPASPPYFLPLPVIGIFGTLGAVIAMPDRIRSRNALLDIGAAGPIAGMVVAIPVLVIGLGLSEVQELGGPGYLQEGQSLLYWAIKRAVLGPMPVGHDVILHPTALAGWAGLLITMLNLLPWGQLDGGHIAYALFGKQHDSWAPRVRQLLLVPFAYNVFQFVVPQLLGESTLSRGDAISNCLFWLVWYAITGGLARLSGGPEHPPFEPGKLSPWRVRVAIGCLALFVALFMPTPMAIY